MDYWRQLDIVTKADLAFTVSVIGCGGIGSPTALALAKMGCPKLTLYDDDTVEPHNLPNQFYRLTDLGRPKVEALREIISMYAECEVTAHPRRVEPGTALSGLVISGVDTMASRQVIWQNVRYNVAVPLYVDARMSAETCRILSVKPTDPNSVRMYEDSLYSDAEALEEPCTARAVIYNVFAVAGLVCNVIKRFARGERIHPDIILDLKNLLLLSP